MTDLETCRRCRGTGVGPDPDGEDRESLTADGPVGTLVTLLLDWITPKILALRFPKLRARCRYCRGADRVPKAQLNRFRVERPNLGVGFVKGNIARYGLLPLRRPARVSSGRNTPLDSAERYAISKSSHPCPRARGTAMRVHCAEGWFIEPADAAARQDVDFY